MCMTFKVPAAKDGSIIAGRSMEFPMGMPSKLSVLPVGFQGAATIGDVKSPQRWTSRYGVVGMSTFEHPGWLVDGLNTEGVSAHLLYMGSGYCTYRTPRGDGSDLSQLDLVGFILGTCSSIDEVKVALAGVNVIGMDPGMGYVPPVHCLVHDRTGSLAIEFHPDQTRVVENPVGLATNAPYLEWHLINLGNFLGISAENPPATVIGSLTVQSLGQGEGFRGIPADYTPPARFVRLFSFLRLIDQAATSDEAELLALHVLNAFDIPKGLINEQMGKNIVPEVTVWDAVLNLSTPRYAYRMIGNPETYVVDLAKIDFTKPVRSHELRGIGSFTPIEI